MTSEVKLSHSDHLPTAVVQCDIFSSGTGEDREVLYSETPRQLAQRAWDEIKEWAYTGYQPVITVIDMAGESHDVDLSEEGS